MEIPGLRISYKNKNKLISTPPPPPYTLNLYLIWISMYSVSTSKITSPLNAIKIFEKLEAISGCIPMEMKIT